MKRGFAAIIVLINILPFLRVFTEFHPLPAKGVEYGNDRHSNRIVIPAEAGIQDISLNSG